MIRPDPLKPLLNAQAIRLVREHAQIVRALAGSNDDRLLATAIEMLLENHDRRKRELESAKQ